MVKGIPKIYTIPADHEVVAFVYWKNSLSNAASMVVEIPQQQKAHRMVKGIPRIYTTPADHEVVVCDLINNSGKFNIKNDEQNSAMITQTIQAYANDS